jgi:hypothetical protein
MYRQKLKDSNDAVDYNLLDLNRRHVFCQREQKVLIRGQVATGNNTKWNYENFAGFYYDLRDGTGTETLTFEGKSP